MSGDERILKID